MNKKIYLVGGAIRDKLLGEKVCDRDYVAVGYSVSEFSHLEQVGKDFPVFLQKDGSQLALARVEKKIGVGYCGFSVDTINVTLEDDLKRRDLTINSIAYDEEQNCYIDPFNGIKDLKNRVLKHTSESFIEDPLRVLRVARFRAKFGYEWKIHPSTKILIYNMKNELKYLQKDRVWIEIEKVMCLKNSYIFFETLFELGVLDIVFPSIYNLTTLKEGTIYHLECTVFEHTMMVLKELKDENILLKLTALYHDIAKPYSYRKFGNSINHELIEIVLPLIDIQIPKKLQSKMLFLIQNHIKVGQLKDMRITKIAKFFKSLKKDRELLINLIKFYNADNLGRISTMKKELLNSAIILNIFDEIYSYSPKDWISTQNIKLSGNQIKEHIHNITISIINKFDLRTQLFQ